MTAWPWYRDTIRGIHRRNACIVSRCHVQRRRSPRPSRHDCHRGMQRMGLPAQNSAARAQPRDDPLENRRRPSAKVCIGASTIPAGMPPGHCKGLLRAKSLSHRAWIGEPALASMGALIDVAIEIRSATSALSSNAGGLRSSKRHQIGRSASQSADTSLRHRTGAGRQQVQQPQRSPIQRARNVDVGQACRGTVCATAQRPGHGLAVRYIGPCCDEP